MVDFKISNHLEFLFHLQSISLFLEIYYNRITINNNGISIQ
jgi:hypothetical protein